MRDPSSLRFARHKNVAGTTSTKLLGPMLSVPANGRDAISKTDTIWGVINNMNTTRRFFGLAAGDFVQSGATMGVATAGEKNLKYNLRQEIAGGDNLLIASALAGI